MYSSYEFMLLATRAKTTFSTSPVTLELGTSDRTLPELGQPPDNKDLIALAACNKMKMQNCAKSKNTLSLGGLNATLQGMFRVDTAINSYLFNKLTVL